VEGLSKAALIKSLSPRVMLSNHLLPKGTKMKVNLEDQDRQKVSFSFAPTKKPLQSPFFIPGSPDKFAAEPNAASLQSTSDNEEQDTDSPTEQNQTPMVPTIAETPSQTPVCSPTILRTDLAQMHFKKQILSVSVTDEKPTSVVPEEPLSPQLQVLQIPASVTEFPVPPPQNVVSVCPSENSHIEAPETRVTPSPKKPPASSGKDGESSSSGEQDSKADKRKTRSPTDSAPPGSESDGDSGQMSSSRKSVDSKCRRNSDSKSKEVKKSSSGSHLEEREKSSSKRSENHERSSSYSKTDRDSRHTCSRSSRSDKDRRRSRSRSRSRSRGSRTSSSHRSERSRGDRGSHSERSYYHDSDRRSHRSSPRREIRCSRSRTDRTRDSSDSEDDHRKTRTRTSDSSRLSAHSSSYKDSKSSSYSKSEKASKSANSPHSSELDKRTQLSKSERTSKRLSDSDSQRKCSPDMDSSYRKSSSHHNSESNRKSSSSSMHIHSQTYEKRQKSSSSDTEADHMGKSQASGKNSGLEENCKNSLKKTSRPDSKQTTPTRSSQKTSRHDRQSNDIFHSPGEAPPSTNATDSCSQSEKEKSFPQQVEIEHCGQDFVSWTETSLQESSSKSSTETKSYLEVETSTVTISESLRYENAAHENLTNVKDTLSSNIQPHVNSNAVDLNACSSNDSVICSQDKKVVDCLLRSSLIDTAGLPNTHGVLQNSEPETVKVLTVEEPSGTSMPLIFDSPCLESEGQLTLEQQNMDTVKKSSGSTKKSRWDIVGQDTPESDNSQRTLCAESKHSVKKVISVKEIEFSKDYNQQDSDMKDTIQQHSMLVKQTEMSKQEVGSDTTDKYKDQNEHSQASASIDHCDLKLRVSQKANTDTPLHLKDASQVYKDAKMQSWNGNDREDKSKGSSHKNKLSKRALLHQHASGEQSEISDSDNSEYDSDCGEAIKRLHSVVVVPKNSSLTMNSHDTGASSRSLHNVNINEIPNPGVQQVEGSPSAFMETNAPCVGVNELFHRSMLCQSQSNMIDSTSQSEGSSSVIAQTYTAGLIGAHGSATDHSRDNSRQCGPGHTAHNISSRGDRVYSHYQHDDFPTVDNVNERNGFSLGWDSTQPEQPSSTYQQPDSSHGPQIPNAKLTETSLTEQEHRQSNATWTHQSPNTQTSRQAYLHGHEHYQDLAGEIHPDSLTNDHDDYSGEKLSDLSKIAVECRGLHTPGSSSFVQGHEISSNSRGSAVPDPPREDHFRPHRGRGPPKKRRPEIESDSDNEAEAGPAGKRERQRDADVPKESHVKDEVQRPTLNLRDFRDGSRWKECARSKKMPPYFDLIEENMYLTER